MVFKIIKGLIWLYALILLILGILNYRWASEYFYSLNRHFGLYLTRDKNITKSIIKGSWCAIIAKDDFLKKTAKEREAFAGRFFDENISRLAAEQGYDVKRLKDWFMRYAWWDVESMPMKEYMLDWKGDNTILYRQIDLSNLPKRRLSYFFFRPEKLKDAFWVLIVIGLPFLAIIFAIRRFLYGVWV